MFTTTAAVGLCKQKLPGVHAQAPWGHVPQRPIADESKCIPILLYGLEVCELSKSQMASLDFTSLLSTDFL